MATRVSMLRYPTAVLAAGIALSLAAPAFADEDAGARRPRGRTQAPVVHTRIVRVPVERVRTVHVPVVRTVRVPVVRTVHVPVVRTVHVPVVRTVERVRTVHVPVVRTVERIRNQAVCYDYTGQQFDCRTPAPVAAPQPVYQGCGSCAAAVAPQVVYAQPTGCGSCAAAVPQYYATGCGGCGQTTYGAGYYDGGAQYYGGRGYYGASSYRSSFYLAAPYRWAARQVGFRHHMHY